MNIIKMGAGKISITFNSIDVEINGIPYQNLMFIVRLLTYDELKRVDSFNTKSELANLIIEEEVFDLTFDKIVGLEDEEVRTDTIEAGIISTIAGTVIEQSYQYVNGDLQEVLAREESETTIVDQMIFLICHSYNMSYDKAKELPINEVYRLYAVMKRTFPQLELKTEESNDQQ